jgi:hypothetical protein
MNRKDINIWGNLIADLLRFAVVGFKTQAERLTGIALSAIAFSDF